MTKEQELKCYFIANEVIQTAKQLSAEYNSLLQSMKDLEHITEIPYDEFKNWLDTTLNDLNEAWNRQCDALFAGESAEAKRISEDMARSKLREIFDD